MSNENPDIAMVEQTIEELTRSRDGWKADAEREARNVAFWREQCDVRERGLQKVEADLADARTRCPVHESPAHGSEAEELRAGIEQILENCGGGHGGITEPLRELLDRVNARDSLAHLETVEQVQALKVVARRVVEAHQVETLTEQVAEGGLWVDKPTGEFICGGCGGYFDSATPPDEEHETPCVRLEAIAALGGSHA